MLITQLVTHLMAGFSCQFRNEANNFVDKMTKSFTFIIELSTLPVQSACE